MENPVETVPDVAESTRYRGLFRLIFFTLLPIWKLAKKKLLQTGSVKLIPWHAVSNRHKTISISRGSDKFSDTWLFLFFTQLKLLIQVKLELWLRSFQYELLMRPAAPNVNILFNAAVGKFNPKKAVIFAKPKICSRFYT